MSHLRRNPQWTSAVQPPHVGLGSGVEESPDDAGVAILRCDEDCGGSVLHGAVGVGVASQQLGHDVQVTALRRHDERSSAVLRGLVDFGAIIEQDGDDVEEAALGGEEQRPSPRVSGGVGFGALVQQLLHQRHVAVGCREDQRRRAVPVGAVDVDAARVEHPNRLLHVAAHRSRMKPLVEARRHPD